MAGNEFDYREIDDVIHGRVRLSVMAYLSGADAADFNELKAKIGGTDGNLSVHLRKLEDAGYVSVRKTFRDRKPRSICRLTAKGREAWIAYIERLQALIEPGA
ncbi:MAG: transcriptional regulator [Parvularculaceae bacterium]|nr:transcriptional regulator [Parvularculaceae bacterium]